MKNNHQIQLPLMSNAIVQNVVGSVLDEERTQHHSFSRGITSDGPRSHQEYQPLSNQSSYCWHQDASHQANETVHPQPSQLKSLQRKTLYNYQEYPPTYYPYPTNFPQNNREQTQWYWQQSKQSCEEPENDPESALRIAMALLRIQGSGSIPSTPSSCSGDSGRFSFTPPPPQDLDYYRNVPPPMLPTLDRSGCSSAPASHLHMLESNTRADRPGSVPPMPTDGRFAPVSFSSRPWENGEDEKNGSFLTMSHGLKLYKVSDTNNTTKLVSEQRKRSQESKASTPFSATLPSRQEFVNLLLLCSCRLEEVQQLCLRVKDVLDDCGSNITFNLAYVSLSRSTACNGKIGIESLIAEAETLCLSIVPFLAEVQTSLYKGGLSVSSNHLNALNNLSDATFELKKMQTFEKQRFSGRSRKKLVHTDEAIQQYTACLGDMLKTVDAVVYAVTGYYEDLCFSYITLKNANCPKQDEDMFRSLDAKMLWELFPTQD